MMSTSAQPKGRTEPLVTVPRVTHIQAVWTEQTRGEDRLCTLQLILDNQVEDVLRSTEDDLNLLFKASEHATFDLDRKVLLFGNLETN